MEPNKPSHLTDDQVDRLFDSPPDRVIDALARIDQIADDLPVRGTIETIEAIALELHALTDTIRLYSISLPSVRSL